jgi:hypothetical protein
MTKDYSKNKIYKIYSHLGDKIYIGSTVCDLVSQRMVKHRGSYKQWKKNNERYTTSFILFEEYGVENCIIELIEAKPCLDINEQARLEGSYIRTLECVNKHIPGRTDKEYYQDNKVKILDYKKEYYETNKENMNEISKQYFKDNKERLNQKNACECGGRYTFKNKSSHLRSARHLKYLDNPISGYSLFYA